MRTVFRLIPCKIFALPPPPLLAHNRSRLLEVLYTKPFYPGAIVAVSLFMDYLRSCCFAKMISLKWLKHGETLSSNFSSRLGPDT